MGCPVVIDQLPDTLRWLLELTGITSIDFTLFTAADTFSGLFTTICNILESGTGTNDNDYT